MGVVQVNGQQPAVLSDVSSWHEEPVTGGTRFRRVARAGLTYGSSPSSKTTCRHQMLW